MGDYGRHDQPDRAVDRTATSVANATVTASSGTVSGTATFSAVHQPPTVATAAAASPNPVTGTTCNLSVLGADSLGESSLTYTWSTIGTPPAAVGFSANGSNVSKDTTATFTAAGSYSFQVTIADPTGATATSSVNVAVSQTLTAITVGPPTASLGTGATQQYTATTEDQFGAPLASQPTFTWATTAGTISPTGLLTAPATSVANATVTASSGTVSGTATFSAVHQPPTVATAAAASPNPVTGTTCNLSVLGADSLGESSLTYTWSTIGTPPAAVGFSANGSNVSKDTTATFTAAGSYSFQVTIADPTGATAASNVNVTVSQTLTAITVSPPSTTLGTGGTWQYTATAEDQFGAALALQPTFTWATTAGTISPTGLLTAPDTPVANATVTASSGTVSGTATFSASSQAPTVAVAAAASPNPVTGTTCNLSVLGADSLGESSLTYTWSTNGTPPAAVSFIANDSNASKDTTATFTAAGSYSFQVTITDPSGVSASSNVNVDGQPDAHGDYGRPRRSDCGHRWHAAVHGHGRGPIRRGPGSTTDFHLGHHGRHDRPGRAVNRPRHAGGQCHCHCHQRHGQRHGHVFRRPRTAHRGCGGCRLAESRHGRHLRPLGAGRGQYGRIDPDLHLVNHRHAAGGSQFHANGSNASKDTTATFTAAGSYIFQVTIADPSGETATSSVNVTVDQTLTAITVGPTAATLGIGGTQQYTATAKDQFGAALALQPTFTWATTAGTIAPAGLLTAPGTPVANATVTATSGTVSGTATFPPSTNRPPWLWRLPPRRIPSRAPVAASPCWARTVWANRP